MYGEEKMILFNAFAPDKEDSVEGEDHYWSDNHGVCACVRACARALVCVRLCVWIVRVRACALARVCVRA